MKSLVILTGGKSSRMGRDKTMLPCQGMTFVERIFSSALICFDQVIISTDTAEHGKRIMELPVIAKMVKANPNATRMVIDKYDALGPIGGIMSVFEETDVDRFSIIPVDVPMADMEVLSMLWDKCSKDAIFSQMDGKRSEPLIAAYNRSAYEKLKKASEEGNYKLRAALRNEDIDILEISGEKYMKAFKNYNRQEDLDLC